MINCHFVAIFANDNFFNEAWIRAHLAYISHRILTFSNTRYNSQCKEVTRSFFANNPLVSLWGKDCFLIFAREEKSRTTTQLATAASLLLLRRYRRRADMEKKEFRELPFAACKQKSIPSMESKNYDCYFCDL